MDVKITKRQAEYLYSVTGVTGVYTNIPNNPGYHYSWHAKGTIVVGIGRGPGHHMNFKCDISTALAITLNKTGGMLQGINEPSLLDSVSKAIKQQFRKMLTNPSLLSSKKFHEMVWTSQQARFYTGTELGSANHLVNRHDARTVLIGEQMIKGGQTKRISKPVTGFAVYQVGEGNDFYYRSYDIRENVEFAAGEPLRLIHDPVVLKGTVSGDIRTVELG